MAIQKEKNNSGALKSIQCDVNDVKVDLIKVKVDLSQVKVDLNQVKVDLNQVKVDLDQVKVDLKKTDDQISRLSVEVVSIKQTISTTLVTNDTFEQGINRVLNQIDGFVKLSRSTDQEVGVQGEWLKELKPTVQNHENRITVLEAKAP